MPSGHLVTKWRCIDVDATSSRRIDVNTTSFYVMCSLCDKYAAVEENKREGEHLHRNREYEDYEASWKNGSY